MARKFLQHRVIDVAAELGFNRFKVGRCPSVVIWTRLAKPRAEVADKDLGDVPVAIADAP